MSQEERTKLWERVPYVKLYRYNPKHLYPKLNGFRDNGKWSLKLWQLLHTYWLKNSYWNWQEYVVSIMLISVLNITVTCEWHKAINLNCKVPRTRVIIHRVRSTIITLECWAVTSPGFYDCLTAKCMDMHFRRASAIRYRYGYPADSYRSWTRRKSTILFGHYLNYRSTWDIGVLGYIGIV